MDNKAKYIMVSVSGEGYERLVPVKINHATMCLISSKLEEDEEAFFTLDQVLLKQSI